MLSPLPRCMNRCRPPWAHPTKPEGGNARTHSQQAEDPLARDLDPPPHTPEQATAAARPQPAMQASEGRNHKLYQHVKAKSPSDEGICCARGGTRTGLQPLQTLGTRENIRNPAQSDVLKSRSEAKCVDAVHTRFLGVPGPLGHSSAQQSEVKGHLAPAPEVANAAKG